MKRIVLFWIPLLLLLLVNCTTESFDFGDQEGILVEGSGGGGSSQPNPTIPEGSEDLLGFTIAFDESDRTTYGSMSETVTSDDDFIENSQFASVVTITYNGTTATVGNGVSGVEVSSNGAHIVVNSTVSGVEYVLNGTTTNGSFKVYSENKFKLSLAGVSILNPVGAAINIQSSKRVFVVCADETTNVLTDGSSYTATTDGEDMKACLFSEGQLIFSGGGSLTVTGNYKHAITSDDYVRFRSGCNITVVSAKKDGIHTNESVIIGGGILNISSDGDAIQCEEGGITMTGGFAKLSTTDNKAHGLKSCLDVVISGGAIQAQVAGAASKGISCDGNLTISGGKLTAFTSQTALYEDNDLSSCAGIKCDGNILITGGEIAIQSTGGAGKGINCDGSITINDGTVKVITTGTQCVYGKLDSSALRKAFCSTFGWKVEVNKPCPNTCWIVRSLFISSSNTFTEAPSAIAARVATVPALPAPMITTSVGETPGMPPNKIPFPPCVLLNNSEAIVIEAVPSISEITFRTGQRCLSSANSS